MSAVFVRSTIYVTIPSSWGAGPPWQAQAVLAALDGAFDALMCEQLRIRTFQLHNGRERHAALVMERGLGGPCKLVSFGECRNSDCLMVWVSTLDRAPFNQPAVSDLSDAAFHGSASNGDVRAGFECGNIMSAVQLIVDTARSLCEPGEAE